MRIVDYTCSKADFPTAREGWEHVRASNALTVERCYQSAHSSTHWVFQVKERDPSDGSPPVEVDPVEADADLVEADTG